MLNRRKRPPIENVSSLRMLRSNTIRRSPRKKLKRLPRKRRRKKKLRMLPSKPPRNPLKLKCSLLQMRLLVESMSKTLKPIFKLTYKPRLMLEPPSKRSSLLSNNKKLFSQYKLWLLLITMLRL